MSLPAAKRDREYQFFKNSELFNSGLAADTAGSIALITDTPRIGDLMIYNNGSSNIYYNIGCSGGTNAVSTSGTLLSSGAKIAYNNVGFDVVSFITTAGVSRVYTQKIYDDLTRGD